MTENERNRVGRELAELVHHSPPILKDAADLLEYKDYVEAILYSNRMDVDAILLRARFADPKFAAAMKKKQAKFWKRVNHRKSLPQQGAAARRNQGAQTRSAVSKAWHSLSNLPKHNRAALIAQRCKISDRAVRVHLKSAGLI
jgi:hypothetical protein